jgi:cation transport ATPase
MMRLNLHKFMAAIRVSSLDCDPGAIVYAGMINQSGALEVRVERLGRDTTLGKIIEAVETAEKSRSPIQGIAAGLLVMLFILRWARPS